MRGVGHGATRQDPCEDNDLRCVRPLIRQKEDANKHTQHESNAQRHPLEILKPSCLQLSTLQSV